MNNSESGALNSVPMSPEDFEKALETTTSLKDIESFKLDKSQESWLYDKVETQSKEERWVPGKSENFDGIREEFEKRLFAALYIGNRNLAQDAIKSYFRSINGKIIPGHRSECICEDCEELVRTSAKLGFNNVANKILNGTYCPQFANGQDPAPLFFKFGEGRVMDDLNKYGMRGEHEEGVLQNITEVLKKGGISSLEAGYNRLKNEYFQTQDLVTPTPIERVELPVIKDALLKEISKIVSTENLDSETLLKIIEIQEDMPISVVEAIIQKAHDKAVTLDNNDRSYALANIAKLQAKYGIDPVQTINEARSSNGFGWHMTRSESVIAQAEYIAGIDPDLSLENAYVAAGRERTISHMNPYIDILKAELLMAEDINPSIDNALEWEEVYQRSIGSYQLTDNYRRILGLLIEAGKMGRTDALERAREMIKSLDQSYGTRVINGAKVAELQALNGVDGKDTLSIALQELEKFMKTTHNYSAGDDNLIDPTIALLKAYRTNNEELPIDIVKKVIEKVEANEYRGNNYGYILRAGEIYQLKALGGFNVDKERVKLLSAANDFKDRSTNYDYGYYSNVLEMLLDTVDVEESLEIDSTPILSIAYKIALKIKSAKSSVINMSKMIDTISIVESNGPVIKRSRHD